MTKFKFELGENVSLVCSDERGTVTGRAEYSNSNNDYRVRYKAADGRQVEAWHAEDALTRIAVESYAAATS